MSRTDAGATYYQVGGVGFDYPPRPLELITGAGLRASDDLFTIEATHQS